MLCTKRFIKNPDSILQDSNPANVFTQPAPQADEDCDVRLGLLCAKSRHSPNAQRTDGWVADGRVAASRSGCLENRGHALTAADAHGLEAVAEAAAPHLVHERSHDAHA